MPQTLSSNRTEGQRAEELQKKHFGYVKQMSFVESFKHPRVTPIIGRDFFVGKSNTKLHANTRFNPFLVNSISDSKSM